MTIRVRRWCFTLNNPTDEEKATFLELIDDIEEDSHDTIRYLHYQEEEGESGTPHLQGYVAFKTKQQMGEHQNNSSYGVKGLLRSNRLSLRPCRGTEKQNIDYCSKEDGRKDGPYFAGTPLKKGQRTDLEGFRDRTVSRTYKTFKDVFESEDDYKIAIRYSGMVKNVLPIYAPTRNPSQAPEIIVYYGTTGTGKSHLSHTTYSEAYILPVKEKLSDKTWWNGYSGETEVIVDDYDWRKYPINYMLKLFDRQKMRVEFKGGMCSLNAYKFIVTTNFQPKEWYIDDKTLEKDAQYNPLMRRLKQFGKIFRMTNTHIIEEDIDGKQIGMVANHYSWHYEKLQKRTSQDMDIDTGDETE